MNNKLYVGNLGSVTEQEELRRAFAPFGTLVSVSVTRDRVTGQSRGFGFVEYDRGADAQRALVALDGFEFGGHCLNVAMARERSPKPRFNWHGEIVSGMGRG